ncbi:RNA polymerase sigma-70 factor (ECF subfamily) [Actinomadura coerulea]|uniref:RNA polymerase sigma-70 factor (ECF subfamily) n=1 Tax=Actinomadura coerulea TaxID=46159 RepID=A0A7X0FW99_9ACTN|nr:sigma-70 family RNA polymerase sigma factor [Actinomadura coerulea]MBB6394880.1 RNA polymerase sigma-70 factor (ECF subfamily) [Actinomadura coerulea]GGQ31422.1 DNA-directed RNA polymerase sigma-70 factor [Actinomadura coerulea]
MHDQLAEHFEAHRANLRAVAYRMLGNPGETDDAVQEAWLRLTRHGPAGIDDLEAWLRTVVARICLDMLRARTSRREEPYGWHSPVQPDDGDPETETVLIESVGRAMLVVLDTLGPAERVALVLHDVFAVPFDQIAPIVERTPATAKKLASRARQRVRGAAAPPSPERAEQRRVVEAFLAAARSGDLDALLAVLAPDVVRRADHAALTPGRPAVLRGAGPVAREMRLFGRRAAYAAPALVDGTLGAVVAPHGRLLLALAVTVHDGRVTAYEMIADPARLTALDLAVP